MNLITAVTIGFLILEAINVITLYFFPESKLANGIGVFKAWEKSKADPVIHNFIKYLVNWVAGTKLIFILLLIAILISSILPSGCKKSKDKQAKKKNILEKIIIPPPNMIFAAIQTSGKIEWDTIISYNEETNYTSFEKIGLNLGSRVADGFVAIMAENKDNMNKMGKAIKTLAKKIGIGK